MTKRERFLATVGRRPVDRPASWMGLPVTEALPQIYRYFQAETMRELKEKIGDDVWAVELPYHNGGTNAIYAAFDFAKTVTSNAEGRTLTAAGFFADCEDPADVDTFDWPDPSLYISPAACRRAVEEAPPGYAVMGVVWSAHMQDTFAAFGMEEALIKMKLEPDVFEAVISRITDFYLQANEIFYEATKGKLDAVLIGNDFGTQTALIASADDLRRFVFPGTKKLIEQAHRYGLAVIHHSCGAVSEVIPDLIACGADVIHPIQALASGMEPQRLHDLFGDAVSFCGGVDAQHLLVSGSTGDVRSKVKELTRIFPTGLIISPSHEAILTDIPPENIEAIFAALKGE